jgi:hypothetical protein
MGLQALALAGAPALLEQASQLITKRGLAKGITYDNGSIDATGALCLAGGAKIKTLNEDPIAELSTIKRPLILVLIEALEAELDSDLHTWNDLPTTTTTMVASTFKSLADKISIATR